MIVTTVNDHSRYAHLHSNFKVLFDYIKTHDILNCELGRIEIDGDNVFINNVLLDGVAIDKQPLELHQTYIDVHILFEGNEMMGWLPTDKIKSFTKDYDAECDCALTNDSPSAYISLQPLDMVIVYPEDAHAPPLLS